MYPFRLDQSIGYYRRWIIHLPYSFQSPYDGMVARMAAETGLSGPSNWTPSPSSIPTNLCPQCLKDHRLDVPLPNWSNSSIDNFNYHNRDEYDDSDDENDDVMMPSRPVNYPSEYCR